MTFALRPPRQPAICFALLVLFIAGCGGGGSSPNAPPPGNAPGPPAPAITSADASVPLTSANVATALPPVAGYSEAITLAPNDAPAGSRLQMTISLAAPQQVSPLPSSFGAKTAMMYFTATADQTVTFQTQPSFALNAPAQAQLANAAVWLAFYDPAKGWVQAGQAAIQGNSVSVSGATLTTIFQASRTYAFAIYSTNEIAGCPTPQPTATASGSPSPVPTSTGAFPANIYVGHDLLSFNPSNETALFAGDADGNAAPVRLIVGGGSTITNDVISDLGLDSANNLYTAYELCGCFEVFPPTANGTNQQIRTVSDPSLNDALSLAIDASDNTYVGSEASPEHIDVYPAGANGTTGPIRTLILGATGLPPLGMAFSADGRLYVSTNNNTILIFDAGSNGAVSPLANISGANTGLNTPAKIAFDSSGVLYVVNRFNPGSITEYATGATGNVAPIRTIEGSNTGLNLPEGVSVDVSGRVYVANEPSNSNDSNVVIFSPNANGNVAPERTISGSATTLFGNRAIIVR